MNIFERKNTDLIKEFNRYIRERPDFARNIPHNAIVVMQTENDKKFNKWSQHLAKTQAKEGCPIVYVRIRKLRPIRSRIEDLRLERVA